jgi:hypothetical protein
MLSTVETKLPTLEELRNLTMSDLAVMSKSAVDFKERLKKYVAIDPYTARDPFEDQDQFSYSIILDRQHVKRVISIIASEKGSVPQLPWNEILKDTCIRLPTPKEEARTIKHQLMPKDTNNFYPYRRSTKVAGYVMLASQICGLN